MRSWKPLAHDWLEALDYKQHERQKLLAIPRLARHSLGRLIAAVAAIEFEHGGSWWVSGAGKRAYHLADSTQTPLATKRQHWWLRWLAA